MKQLSALFILLLSSFAFAAPSLNPSVLMETTKGEIVLELYPQQAPKTVANFLAYVEKDGFQETTFHRVINGFMVQGGGFNASGDRAVSFSPVKNESQNGLSNERGTIAMARTNHPHSATRQFFINQKDNHFLDSRGGKWGYTVFGRVTSGIWVVDEIAAVKTDHQDKPQQAVIIKRISLIEQQIKK